MKALPAQIATDLTQFPQSTATKSADGTTSVSKLFPLATLAILLTIIFYAMVGEARADFDYQRYVVKKTAAAKGIDAGARLTAETVQVSTPKYSPDMSTFHPNEGKYTYGVSWAGIPAASAVVDVRFDGTHYVVSADVKTARAIDLFYKLRADFDGRFSAKDFSPIDSSFYSRENSRRKFSQLKFLENGDIYAVRGKRGKGASAIQFNTGNPTLDPFSAAFVARSLAWKPGQERVFDAYNGKSRYLISLTCTEQTTIEVNGQLRPVWVISPQVKKLLDTKASKLREARIYITADSAREILKIESEVFVGTVKTALESFVPHSSTAATVARLAN